MRFQVVRWLGVLAVAGICGVSTAVAQPAIPAGLEELALRLAAEPGGDEPDPNSVEVGPDGAAPLPYEEDHPYLLLGETLQRLACASGAREAVDCIDGVPAEAQSSFVRSHEAAQKGFAAYSAMEPDALRGGRMLAAAARRLPKRGDAAVLAVAAELRGELAEAVRQIALRALDRATVAGVDGRRLARATEQMNRGDALVLAGEPAKAAGWYQKPIKLKNAIVFDMDVFEQGIRSRLDGQTIGYTYALNRDGQLAREDGVGSSRLPGESNPTLQDPRKRMQIASVTKNITAVALLQLLEANDIAVNESISPYLPPDWTLGPGVTSLSFGDLLRHESGLDNNSGASGSNFGTTLVYSGLQSTIAGGQTAMKTFIYQNVNYALFRVIIPTLFWGGNPADVVPDDGILPEDNPSLTSLLYEWYVRNNVLEPSEVVGLDDNNEWASLSRNAATETLSYFFPNASGNVSGASWGNWSTIAGGGGWYLSAYDLAAFLAHVRYDDAILSPASRSLMDTQFFGYNDPAVSNFFASFALGKFGVYRGHGGDLGNGGTPTKGMDSCIMNFPQGVQAVVLINSVGGSYSYQCDVLQEAYDDAFVKK
jgi:CubicO group peptidase (beta-lactamase class C family)